MNKVLPALTIVLFFLIPSGRTQTQDTNHYIEWKQSLFAKTNQTAASFTNTTFNVTTPHDWTHVSGQSYVEIIGYTSYQGSLVNPTQFRPFFKFDNHDFTTPCLDDYQAAAGDTASKLQRVFLRCTVDRWVTNGTHGIRMLDSQNADGPTLNYSWTFYLIQAETVQFSQPDARPLITGSASIPTDTLLVDSTDHRYDLNIYRFGSNDFPNTQQSKKSNATAGKFSNGLRTGFFDPPCHCAETVVATFLPGFFQESQFIAYQADRTQNLSFFAAFKQYPQDQGNNNYTKFAWQDTDAGFGSNVNFDLECYLDAGSGDFHVFYSHTGRLGGGLNTTVDAQIADDCADLTTLGFTRTYPTPNNGTVTIYVNDAEVANVSEADGVADFLGAGGIPGTNANLAIPFFGPDPTAIGVFDVYEMRVGTFNDAQMHQLMNLTDNTYTNKTIGNEWAVWLFEPPPPSSGGGGGGDGGVSVFTTGLELGTTSTLNVLVMLAIALCGVYIWRGPDRNKIAYDIFPRIVGSVVVIIDFLIALEFRNAWDMGLWFAVLLGAAAFYLLIMGAYKEFTARRDDKMKL